MTELSRRDFLRFTASAACLAATGRSAAGNESPIVTGPGPRLVTGLRGSRMMHPLFFSAYITPDAPGQFGQEKIVARFPLLLVPQDMRAAFRKWRDWVRRYNPEIFLLAYMMAHEETTVPGPGHDRLRSAGDIFIRYPGGYVPKVGPADKRRRIFDLRRPEWRNAFLEGCKATLDSYSYDGLFLDQCTVFGRAHPSPFVRAEMREALQETLLELRGSYPDALIIGNSSYNWTGLNGEMNENRPDDVATELKPYAGHASPIVELVMSYLKHADETDRVEREMKFAHSYGAFYGACVDPQHALWFDSFEKVLQTSFKT